MIFYLYLYITSRFYFMHQQCYTYALRAHTNKLYFRLSCILFIFKYLHSLLQVK